METEGGAAVKRSFQNKLMAAAVKYMGQPNKFEALTIGFEV
jgi:hypothetical protein